MDKKFRRKDESCWEQEPSVQAVRKGKEAILELIGDDVSRIVMRCDSGDYSLLLIAVCEGNKETVQFLLDREASVHLEGRDHWSLHLAAEEGHEEILKLLIHHLITHSRRSKFDFNKDFKDYTGKTLLHSAVSRNINVVKYLLDLGADINAIDNSKRCVLLMAMQTEQENIVEFLLERGCRLNWKDTKGNRLLHEAAKIGNKAILQLLVDHGELDVNAQNKDKRTALHFACERGKEDVVKFLIERGAQVNATDCDGRTMHHYAAHGGNTDVLKLMMNYGIDVNIGCNRETALHVACRQGHEEIVKILINGGAQKNGWYRRPLWYEAFQSGNMNLIMLLIDHGHDINLMAWSRPLPYLLYKGNYIETLKAIIERGVDITQGLNDSLHEAVRDGNKHLNMLEFLIQNGCDLNNRNNHGHMGLHTASERGYNQVVEILVENGAAIDATTYSDHSSLWLACVYGHESTVQLLLGEGASIEVNNRNNKNVVEQLLDGGYKLPAEILVRLIVRMKSQKLPVSKNIFESIEKDNEMRAYKVKCEEELESMRSDDSKLAFWRLLMSNNRCLAGFARNKEMIRALKSDECETKVPIYSSLLKNQMIRGIWRKTLLDKVQYFFKAVGESKGNEHLPKLPILCVREIFSYFSNRDFKNLIKVCDPHNDFEFKMNNIL